MTEETLEGFARRLGELENERNELVTWLKAEGYEPTDNVTFLQFDKQAKLNRLRSVTAEIEKERQRYTAQLLNSMQESSQRLERSSLRLEAFTGGLLVLTAVLAVAGAGSYFLQAEEVIGIPGKEALAWASIGVVAVLILILVAFFYLSLRYRPQLRALH